MDLEQLWKNSRDGDSALNAMLMKGDFQHLHSKIPLNKLRRNLLIGLWLAVIITVFYICLLFYFHFTVAYITLTVLIIFNITIIADTWKLYRRTPATISPGLSLRAELTVHYNSFTRWWDLQQRISIFVYPIAAAGGFLMGGVMGSGKPIAEFILDPALLIVFAVTVAVIVPACYFGARFAFRNIYGKHLERLKNLIDELS